MLEKIINHSRFYELFENELKLFVDAIIRSIIQPLQRQMEPEQNRDFAKLHVNHIQIYLNSEKYFNQLLIELHHHGNIDIIIENTTTDKSHLIMLRVPIVCNYITVHAIKLTYDDNHDSQELPYFSSLFIHLPGLPNDHDFSYLLAQKYGITSSKIRELDSNFTTRYYVLGSSYYLQIVLLVKQVKLSLIITSKKTLPFFTLN